MDHGLDHESKSHRQKRRWRSLDLCHGDVEIRLRIGDWKFALGRKCTRVGGEVELRVAHWSDAGAVVCLSPPANHKLGPPAKFDLLTARTGMTAFVFWWPGCLAHWFMQQQAHRLVRLFPKQVKAGKACFR